MKRLSYLFVALAATTGLQAHADVNTKMVLYSPGGKSEVPVTSINRISFDGNIMSIDSSEGNTKVDVLTLDRVIFDIKASAVDNLVKDFDNGVTISARAGVINVSAEGDNPVTIAVYGINGAMLHNVVGQGSVTVDLNQLAPGVYIVKANDKTIKFTR